MFNKTPEEKDHLRRMAMSPGWPLLKKDVSELIILAMRRNPGVWNVLRLAFTQGEIRSLVMVNDLLAEIEKPSNTEDTENA